MGRDRLRGWLTRLIGERPDAPNAPAGEDEPPVVDETSPPSLDPDSSWSLVAPIEAAPQPTASTLVTPGSPAGPGQEGSPAAEQGPDGATRPPTTPGLDERLSSPIPEPDEPAEAAPRVRRYRAGVETAPDDLLRVPEATAQIADEFFEDLSRRAKGR